MQPTTSADTAEEALGTNPFPAFLTADGAPDRDPSDAARRGEDNELAPLLERMRYLMACIGRRDLTANRPRDDDEKRRILWRHRRFFGITRIGSVTRLDRIGIPVAQAVRPNAQSNVVSQGKGATFTQAFISSALEALETWAAERIPRRRVHFGIGKDDRDFFSRHAPAHMLGERIDGLDLLTGASEGVPISFVETRYIVPTPYRVPFDQTTTGLAAGFDLEHVISHALSELLERYSIRDAEARADLVRIDLATTPHASTRALIERIEGAGVYVTLEAARCLHRVPVFKCWVADRCRAGFPRLPAVGFGCRADDELALNAAILEAVQARLAALSGSREDITRRQYPPRIGREEAEGMLVELISGEARQVRYNPVIRSTFNPIAAYIRALRSLGAEAVYVVPLYRDLSTDLNVVRVVAPPLFGS
jgi:ribosomal protein S12 methylthiotransferase accessory factor